MNGYKCFWNGKTIDIWAKTIYEAQQKATIEFQKGTRKKVKEYQVSPVLCERADGSQVIHSTAELG